MDRVRKVLKVPDDFPVEFKASLGEVMGKKILHPA
jgi:hypothetical protein